jgi:hypothetical protein
MFTKFLSHINIYDEYTVENTNSSQANMYLKNIF